MDSTIRLDYPWMRFVADCASPHSGKANTVRGKQKLSAIDYERNNMRFLN